jgi:hypothetical protein
MLSCSAQCAVKVHMRSHSQTLSLVTTKLPGIDSEAEAEALQLQALTANYASFAAAVTTARMSLMRLL